MNALFYVLLYFFACIGVIQVVASIYTSMRARTIPKKDITIVMAVKNQQDTVEGQVRSLVSNCVNMLEYGFQPHIIVVDMGSYDQTTDVLNKLVNDCEFLEARFLTTES